MDGLILTENLSERERAYLEHVKQARELGASFSEYCKSFGLDVREWYAVKRELVRRGVLPRRGSRTEAEDGEESGEASPSAFIPVHIAPSATAPPQIACRIRHPYGWVFECMTMPEAAWVAALVAEEPDAAPGR